MKKEGFTLIETLVVIALLAALSVTIGLSFSNMMDKQRENEQKDYEKTIEDAACMYAEKNNINGEYGVKVKTLIEEGLLNKNLINPETKEAIINYQENCIAIKYEENERTCKYTLNKCAKYILPHVSNAEVSVTTESLTIKIVAEAGTNKIKKYYFSKDNGVTYEESTSDTYTFENLVDNTSYSIKVKVSDTLNKESNIYSVDGKTEEMQKYWEYIEDGTFTVPKSGKYKIEMHGGGGGGGGGAAAIQPSEAGCSASGGGGGGSGETYIIILTKDASYNIIIGSGGSGGRGDVSVRASFPSAGGTNGKNGGSTSFGSLYSVSGGEGGIGGSARFPSLSSKAVSYGSGGTKIGSLAQNGESGTGSGSSSKGHCYGGEGGSSGSSNGKYGYGGAGGNAGHPNYGGSGYYANSGESGQPGAVFITYLGEN